MRTTMNDMITDSNVRENFEERTQEDRATKRGFWNKAASVAGFLYAEFMKNPLAMVMPE